MTLTEKAAYIKGMMEGMAFEPQTNEDKLLKAVVDLLDDMASDLSKLSEQVADVNEYVEELDDDLAQVESVLEEDEDDYDDEDEEYETCLRSLVRTVVRPFTLKIPLIRITSPVPLAERRLTLSRLLAAIVTATAARVACWKKPIILMTRYKQHLFQDVFAFAGNTACCCANAWLVDPLDQTKTETI